jgi:hypothetical protein
MAKLSEALRRKRPPKFVPLDLGELSHASGMSGFADFLTEPVLPLRNVPLPPGGPDPFLHQPESSSVGAPTVGAPTVMSSPKSDTLHLLVSPTVTAGDPTAGAPNVDAPIVERMDFGPEPDLPVGRPRTVPANTVQHGHTLLEQAVYQVIWQMAPKNPALCYRELETGERTIASVTRTSYSNAQRCVAALSHKLAIEILPPLAPGRAKRLRIFDYAEILRRRRAAGLTHVIRNRGAVTLVNPGYETIGAPTIGAPTEVHRAPSVGAPQVNLGAPQEPTVGAPPRGALIRNKENALGTSATTLPSAASPIIVRALREATGKSDDAAATRIASECRANAADATDDEIAAFILERAAILRKAPAITNPMGLLIRMVPKSCTGESLRQHRAEVDRMRQEAAQRQARDEVECRQLAQSILDHPDEWPSEQVDWARDILGRAGQS